MLPLLSVSVSYLFIDVSLALTALAIGFFSGLCYVRHTTEQAHGADGSAADSNKKVIDVFEAERVNMAALQLRDLAANMAIDASPF